MGSIEASTTWLEVLQSQLSIDIDCMDPAEAQRWLPFKPQDQTSNQRLVYEQMVSPSNRDLFVSTVKEYKGQTWQAILDRMSVLLCAKNIENIKGRVLLQTSAAFAYDTAKVVAHARNYALEFSKLGISKDRFCIKVPCTGPAMNAARILLEEDGIRTLGTSLFSLPQAIAASQAGCLSISPYYNLPWYHTNPELWPDVQDPALEHPMSARIVQILHTYKQSYEETGQKQPLLKPASFKSAREAMAMAELGCHSATIPENIIQDLSMLDFESNPPAGDFAVQGHPGSPSARLAHLLEIDLLSESNPSGVRLASTKIDYLADNGAALTEAIANDPVTERGLKEALEAFAANELQSRAAIEELMAQL